MAKFRVTIVKTVITEISVEGIDAAEARRAVEDYGVDLAAIDYPGSEISVSARIKSVRAARAA